MVMTTPEARKTLATLERLVAIFEQRSTILSHDQRQLLHRLRGRRRTLRDLLAAREAALAQAVIDFALWRDDPLPPSDAEPVLDADVV